MNIETDSGLLLEARTGVNGTYISVSNENGMRLDIHRDTWDELVQLIPVMTGWRASVPVNTRKVPAL